VPAEVPIDLHEPLWVLVRRRRKVGPRFVQPPLPVACFLLLLLAQPLTRIGNGDLATQLLNARGLVWSKRRRCETVASMFDDTAGFEAEDLLEVVWVRTEAAEDGQPLRRFMGAPRLRLP